MEGKERKKMRDDNHDWVDSSGEGKTYNMDSFIVPECSAVMTDT